MAPGRWAGVPPPATPSSTRSSSVPARPASPRRATCRGGASTTWSSTPTTAGWRVAAPVGLADHGGRARRGRPARRPGAGPLGRRRQRRRTGVVRRLRAALRPAGAPPHVVDAVTGDGDLLVVHAGTRDLAHPHPGQRHRHLDPAVRAALPGHRDLRRRAAAHARLPRARSTSPAAGSSWSAAGPRPCSSSASSPRSRTPSGSPAASRSGAPATSTPRPVSPRSRWSPTGYAVGCRRPSVVGVTGLALRPQEREAERLGAYRRRPMFDRIEPDRRAVGRPFDRLRTSGVRARRRDPVGHRLPARRRPPRPAAAAQPRGGHPARGRRRGAERGDGRAGPARPARRLRTLGEHDRRQPGGSGGGHRRRPAAWPSEADLSA